MSGSGKSKQISSVVVGVDGSAGSSEALHWAIAEARLRNAPLRAVHAWIERVIGEGSAAQVLIDAVGEDDLLVVGSRGHGGFANLLLGSVSQQCAQHAPCPVVIVRGTTASNAREGVS